MIGKNSPNSESRASPYRKQLLDIAKMANYEPIASIPHQSSDFNYTFAQNGSIKKKRVDSDVTNVPSSPVEKVKLHPSFKLPKIDKGSHIQHNPTNVSDNHDRFLTIDTRLDTQQQSNSLFLNCSREGPRKQEIKNSKVKKAQRYEKKKMYFDEEESQTDEQYSANTNPGPGYYSVNSSTFFTKNINTNSSFGSKATRFVYKSPEHDISFLPRQSKKEEAPKSFHRKKLIPFQSGSLRKKEEINKNPSPQDYQPRNGIEEQLIKRIQRSFKGNFGTSQQRFPKDKNSNLGPGSYFMEGEEERSDKQSHYFLSKKARFS